MDMKYTTKSVLRALMDLFILALLIVFTMILIGIGAKAIPILIMFFYCGLAMLSLIINLEESYRTDVK